MRPCATAETANERGDETPSTTHLPGAGGVSPVFGSECRFSAFTQPACLGGEVRVDDAREALEALCRLGKRPLHQVPIDLQRDIRVGMSRDPSEREDVGL